MNSTSGSGKLALVGMALLALALGGCGRKTILDPPPQASVQAAPGQPGAPAAPRSNPFGLFDPIQEEETVAPAGQKRRLPIDVILD